MARREYGTGSVYQRCETRYGCPDVVDGERPAHKCRARWYGSIEAGWTGDGKRRRLTATGRNKSEATARLRAKQAAYDSGELTSSPRITVKQWAEEYARMRVVDLRPKAYKAAMNPIKNWVVPTIGHRRLSELNPGDVRAVADAQVKAGRQPNDTHRTMMTMLRHAVREGHQVPQAVLLAKSPPPRKSDRMGMSVDEGLAMIKAAAGLPHGSRWLLTLLYGQRMGECLGLTWSSINWDVGAYGEATIEWQLQPLPYKVARDRKSGFLVPADHDAIRLVDAYHLVRPKSGAGYRVAPFLEPVRDALLAWQKVAPRSPHDLVWPNADGRPKNDKDDRAEWHALQKAAGVAHPSGRPYHVHECRWFAATMLLEAGVDEHIITTLLGHSSVVQSRKYMTVRREPLLEAMQRVGKRLQLGELP